MRTTVAATIVACLLIGCGPQDSTSSAAPTAVTSPPSCRVTLAFQRPPDQIIDWARAGANPPVSHDEAVEHSKRTNWVGADGIWISLPANGRVTWGTHATGSKFPLWMTASGVATATARRIDAATPPGVIAHFNGANPSGEGPGFNSSSITFPTNGCWEVTYHVGDVTLKFVVDVIIS
jgi:hypothetical protein